LSYSYIYAGCRDAMLASLRAATVKWLNFAESGG
jgi:hypothetical protein